MMLRVVDDSWIGADADGFKRPSGDAPATTMTANRPFAFLLSPVRPHCRRGDDLDFWFEAHSFVLLSAV